MMRERDAEIVAAYRNDPEIAAMQDWDLPYSLSRQNYYVRGRWDDDLRYAMLRADRAAWLTRPVEPPAAIELVEIRPDDAHLWSRVVTHYSQERLVSPVLRSFRDALFPEVWNGAPVVPWLRGILADDERVGFVMLAVANAHHPEPYLWRLLIDRLHQRRKIGSMVLNQLREQLSAQGHRSLTVSFHEGRGGPRLFYERHGFAPAHGITDDDDEIGARLSW